MENQKIRGMYIDPLAKPFDYDPEIKNEVVETNSVNVILINAPIENLGEDKNNSYAVLPGFGQYIFEYMNNAAHRELQAAAIMATLQTLSAVSPNIIGYNKTPLGLVTFTACPSGAGKDKPQKIFDDIICAAGMAAAGKFTSTKSIFMDIYHGKRRAAFLSDEVHEQLAAMTSKKSEYMNGSEGAIMSITESNKAKLSSTYKADICKLISDEIKGYKANIKKLQANENDDGNFISPEKAKSIIAKIEAKIIFAETELKQIRETGSLNNVRLNFFGSTTPIEMEPYINKRMLNNGFLARCLFAYIGEVNPSKKPTATELELNSIQRYAAWVANRKGEITAEPDAEDFLEGIRLQYDESHYLNNKDYGALYRRMYAKTCKVASLLAVGNHDLKITSAQAEAAYEIVRESFENLKDLCENGDSTSEKLDFMKELELDVYKIINANGEWCSSSVLAHKIFKRSKTIVKMDKFRMGSSSFMNELQGLGYIEAKSGERGGKQYKLTQLGRNRGDELLKENGEM